MSGSPCSPSTDSSVCAAVSYVSATADRIMTFYRKNMRNRLKSHGIRISGGFMKKRKLGNSGMEVAPLALGGNVFGWTADEPTSFRILDSFAAAGWNLIDTG